MHAMQTLMESFELDRCSHVVCPDDKESLPSDSSILFMPPPVKFMARSGVVQEQGNRCIEVSVMAQNKERLMRRMGEMIIRDEAAKWICGDEQSRRSASLTASLIAGLKAP